ncbi:Uncharacterised protein [uncultured archaeon]|nr:Uncharacterised protein [uncultured archaeon]
MNVGGKLCGPYPQVHRSFGLARYSHRKVVRALVFALSDVDHLASSIYVAVELTVRRGVLGNYDLIEIPVVTRLSYLRIGKGFESR